MISENSF